MTLDDALDCARVLLQSWNWRLEGRMPDGEYAYSVAVDACGRICRLELRLHACGSVRSRALLAGGDAEDDEAPWQLVRFDSARPEQLELAMLEAIGSVYESVARAMQSPGGQRAVLEA